MMLAGFSVPDRDVLTLAALTREAGFVDLAKRLEDAYDREVKVLGLTVPERGMLLWALDDPPREFAQLRDLLLAEHEGRVRQGLV